MFTEISNYKIFRQGRIFQGKKKRQEAQTSNIGKIGVIVDKAGKKHYLKTFCQYGSKVGWMKITRNDRTDWGLPKAGMVGAEGGEMVGSSQKLQTLL